MRITAKTDPGQVRKSNQDTFYAGPVPPGKERTHGRLLLVADGMGGHAAGEVASALAGEVISRHFYAAELSEADNPGPALREAFQAANHAIIKEGGDNLERFGMGTTCSAMVLRDGRFWICHVGDSRIYRHRSGSLECLTRDHTLVQQMVDRGELSQKDAAQLSIRHILVQALGIDEKLAVDLSEHPYPLMPLDKVLLCSDGLSGVLEDEQIAEILQESTGEEAVVALIDGANLSGGPDNITVVLVENLDSEMPERGSSGA